MEYAAIIILVTWPILLILWLRQRTNAKRMAESLNAAQFSARDAQDKLKKIESESTERERALARKQQQIYQADLKINDTTKQLNEINALLEDAKKKLENTKRRTEKYAVLGRSIQAAQERFASPDYHGEELLSVDPDLASFMAPLTDADVKCLQIKELRSRFQANRKGVEKLIEVYQGRYTTKTNAALYKLMALALEAEFRNILYTLRFGKLEAARAGIKSLTTKYYQIVTEGNQSIAPTISKFIGQLETYYLEAVEIEYEYYVKLEAAKEQQRALREQMRQEAEERRELERQRKKIEAEQEKYQTEIDRINSLIETAGENDRQVLQDQLEKVQAQLAEVNEKREDIIKLQNGKAGTVYIISNIGSFGQEVFKVGMTRRPEPKDRISELSNASVPFPFDVHCFIFSEDAVGLETKLHHILNDQRVNKVNLRKEFFHVSLDELQKIVEECDPSAAFTRTAAAEQYYQSQSIAHVDDTLLSLVDDEDDASLSDDDFVNEDPEID